MFNETEIEELKELVKTTRNLCDVSLLLMEDEEHWHLIPTICETMAEVAQVITYNYMVKEE